MKSKVMVITPEIAKEMLKHMPVNRRLSTKEVNKYAYDMQNGEWQENGESICFNKLGYLINGQHRLEAIIKSGCPQKTVIAYDINIDVTLYDRGRNRSASDSLTISGMLATKLTCSMARLYLFSNSKSGINTFSDGQIKEFHVEHEDGIKTVVDILGKSHGSKQGGVNVRVGFFATALLYAYEAKVPEETLRRFTEVVKTGFYDNRTQSAGIVIRNDMICGYLGSRVIADSERSMYAVQNAINDFSQGYNRKRTYKNTTSRVYGKDKG